MEFKKLFYLISFFVLSPLICFADSASIGGQGNTVKILDNNEIQMVDEVIKMVVKEKEIGDEIKWNRDITEVDIVYLFKNTTDKSISVKMGFPEKMEDYEDYYIENSEQKLNDFSAYDENGNAIDIIFRNSKEALTKGVNWYIYDVDFAPFEKKKIQNKYWIINSGYNNNHWFDYILETGASWKDKIEKIDVEVKFEDGRLIYDVSRIEPSGYIFNKKNNSIEWRLSNIEPTKDDNIRVGHRNFPYRGKGSWRCDYDTKYSELSKDYIDEVSTMSSSHLVEDEIGYYACKAVDGDKKTAWVEGVVGSGIGEWISNLDSLYLSESINYQKVKIFNGFGESEELWRKNNRVKKLKIIYPNNQEHIIDLEDIFGYQTIDLPEIIRLKENGYAKLEIMEVYKSTDFDDTAISEVRLLGLIDGDVIEDDSIYDENYIFARNYKMYNRLKGRILLKVEDLGRAYYVNSANRTMSYLNRPADAFQIMREKGIGITNENLAKIPVGFGQGYDKNKVNNSFTQKHLGKIFLQVENNGEAWYVNPEDGKRYFLGRPADAFNVMRNLGLGISNNDFEKL
ncbi:hypothetical protein KAI52_01000 [Candidatus Parcubacteria bacterium]|nr:hypothetical protein [Candidatus Parcubacteria bacterium]